MRLRNIPGADDVILNHPIATKNGQEHKGNWKTVFGNDNPIYIEIGMGKGQFLLTLAKQNPEKFNQSTSAPKEADGSIKKFKNLNN